MNKLILLFIAIVFLSGCATLIYPTGSPEPTVRMVDVPGTQDINIAELGDTIVSKEKVFEYDGIKLMKQVSGGATTIVPGELMAEGENNKFTFYYAKKIIINNEVHENTALRGGLILPKNAEDNVYVFYRFNEGALLSTKTKEKPIYEPIKIKKIEEASFKQELIYNGIGDNKVKFLYRELSNNLMRNAFSQETQYDLRESAVIGFKGVRVEILEATSTNLKYRVLKAFPDYE